MLYDNDTFERGGHKFRVTFPADDFGEASWERGDGYGIVSDWTTRDKKPGERVLNEDHRSKRYYDVAATMKKAKAEGWGLCDDDKVKLAAKLGREPKKGDIIAESVEKDFQFHQSWCRDEWCYVGVVVKLLETIDDDDEDTEYEESLWGIESNSYDYLEETAYELADEILERLAEVTDKRDDLSARTMEAERPDLYTGA